MTISNRYTIKKIVNAILLFFYVFTVAFYFIPGKIRTRMIIGAIGFVSLLFHKNYYKRFISNVVILNLLFFFCVAISFLINDNWAGWFVQHATLNIIYLFGGLYIARRFLSCNISFNEFLYCIVLVVLTHNLIAFTGYLFSPISNFIISVQSDYVENTIIENILQYHGRAFGFGTGSFFLGGVTSGLAIILCCYLINRRHVSVLKGSLIAILLLLTGSFIARTTAIGLIGIFLIFFRGRKFQIGILFKFIFWLTCIGLAVVYFYQSYLKDIISIDWAFEAFVNYMDSGELETKSTNHLKTMWVFPEDFKTWLFGDGLFFNKDDSYYMHTDVGYLRIIYAIGSLGLLVFIINQLYLMLYLNRYDKYEPGVKHLVIIIALYLLISNIKGFSELNYFFYMAIGFLRGKYRLQQ